MKVFLLLKWPILLGCLGAALLLSPACKAQEVDPEHFDGPNTEPFEKTSTFAAPEANGANHKALSKQNAVVAKELAHKSNPTQSVQLTAAHDVSQSTGKDAVAVQNERKTAALKSKDQ